MIKLNRDFFAGAALGFGVGFLTASSKIVQDKRVKDAVKSAIKTGMVGFEKLREEVMRKAESLEDIFVEARSEVRTENEEAIVNTHTSGKSAAANASSTSSEKAETAAVKATTSSASTAAH